MGLLVSETEVPGVGHKQSLWAVPPTAQAAPYSGVLTEFPQVRRRSPRVLTLSTLTYSTTNRGWVEEGRGIDSTTEASLCWQAEEPEDAFHLMPDV